MIKKSLAFKALIFKLRQQVLKSNNICVSYSTPKLKGNHLCKFLQGHSAEQCITLPKMIRLCIIKVAILDSLFF